MPTALVTGAAKRIGKAIALKLADEGYNIIIHYGKSKKDAEDTVQEIIRRGSKASAISADLSDLSQIDRLVSESLRKFKGIDVLVNNAATFNMDKLSGLTNADQFDSAFKASIDPNLKGPVYLATKLGWHMKTKQKSGVIINIGDWAQYWGQTYKDYLLYHISKAGLIGATFSLATELAPEVRVNMIANGPVEPPENFSEKDKKSIASRTALKKWGGADSVAEAVLYLIRNKNSTGDIITNDGGRHLL